MSTVWQAYTCIEHTIYVSDKYGDKCYLHKIHFSYLGIDFAFDVVVQYLN